MLDTDIYDSVRMYLDTVGIRYTTCELTRTFRFRSEDQFSYHLRVARGTLWVQTAYPYKLPPGWVKRFSAESTTQSSGLVLDVSRGELQYRLRIPCDGGCDADRIEEALEFTEDVLQCYYTRFRRRDEE